MIPDILSCVTHMGLKKKFFFKPTVHVLLQKVLELYFVTGLFRANVSRQFFNGKLRKYTRFDGVFVYSGWLYGTQATNRSAPGGRGSRSESSVPPFGHLGII